MNATGNSAGDPLVSVVTITYQHAPYIEGNVRGVLEQRTDFPVEHLIGEDESTDGTREICQRLAQEHPDRIRLFLRSRKDVVHIMGRPTGRANVLGLYQEARGRYIAVCPGDDHWIDPDKLRLQVELMERRPELAACFTNAWDKHGTRQEDYLRPWLNGHVPDAQVTVEQLLAKNYIPSATFLFRRELLFPLPAAFHTAPVGDWILVVHLASQGPIGYIDRHTAVRESHAGGIISMKDELHKLEVNIDTLEAIATMVKPKLLQRVRVRILNLFDRALQLSIDRGQQHEARKMWERLRNLSYYRPTMRQRARWQVLVKAPFLAQLIYRARTRFDIRPPRS